MRARTHATRTRAHSHTVSFWGSFWGRGGAALRSPPGKGPAQGPQRRHDLPRPRRAEPRPAPVGTERAGHSPAAPSPGDDRELVPGCVYAARSTGPSGLDGRLDRPRVPRLDWPGTVPSLTPHRSGKSPCVLGPGPRHLAECAEHSCGPRPHTRELRPRKANSLDIRHLGAPHSSARLAGHPAKLWGVSGSHKGATSEAPVCTEGVFRKGLWWGGLTAKHTNASLFGVLR